MNLVVFIKFGISGVTISSNIFLHPPLLFSFLDSNHTFITLLDFVPQLADSFSPCLYLILDSFPCGVFKVTNLSRIVATWFMFHLDPTVFSSRRSLTVPLLNTPRLSLA